MPQKPDSAADLIPDRPSLSSVRRAAQGCRACDLWKRGTQTVFGVGDTSARLMLVGEQPGDQEDLQGQPFVGPAGRLLDKALAEVGIVMASVHPSSILRAADEDERHAEFERFTADLRKVARALEEE